MSRRPAATAAVTVAAAVAALVAIVAAVPGTWVRSTYGAQLSGDEPHYLITAVSLAEDRDLDVADELAEEAYRPFHEPRLREQAGTRPDGRRLVPHDPLLPALLALPWSLGGWVGARLALGVLAGALAALAVWTAVRRFGVRPWTATAVVGVLSASGSLAAYGSQVYPELPAAFVALTAVAAATGPRPGSSRQLALFGLAITALPWLAVKYVPVAAALTGVHLWRLWRTGRRRPAVGLAAGLAVAAAVFVALHLAWYGGLTPYAAGSFFAERGSEFSVVGDRPAYLGRARRLIGLLVGGQFGLAAWQPLWLLVVPAVAALLRRRPAGCGLLLLPLLAGWLTATFVALTMQGWWFPGRQVVVVLPLAAVALAWWVDGLGARRWLVPAIGLLGVWSWAWLLVQGLRRELVLIVDFASTADPWYRAWRHVLPDYLDVTARTWFLQTVWLTIAAAAAWWAWHRSPGPAAPADGTPPAEELRASSRSRSESPSGTRSRSGSR